MRYLLDTNTVIFAVGEPDILPARYRELVLQGENVVSVLSFWEVMLKTMKGRLSVGEPRAWWSEVLRELNATPLPLRADHISEIQSLPPIHQDPFDRALIAQAMVEGLTLVTLDREIPKYASERFRVLA